MKLIASAAMKKVDTKAIGEMGIPEAVLIENAGRAVADAAQDLLETREDVPPIIFLTARPQDEWLATWAGAAATVSDPIDPIILQETVADVLREAC